jgi:hypothetical protein
MQALKGALEANRYQTQALVDALTRPLSWTSVPHQTISIVDKAS